MEKIVIEGVTEDGKTFRPTAWAEMISSNLASFGRDNKLRYDRGVHPCVIDGNRCLVIARELQDNDPVAYRYVMEFAEQNGLRILRDRRQGERALKYP